jgi:protein tyrosine/serine phosphatase
VLADESNYPIFFHCAIGTDRTGTLAYLINGLLGVPEEDLYYDYCFSNFGAIYTDNAPELRTPKTLQSDDKVAAVINATQGRTLQEKI